MKALGSNSSLRHLELENTHLSVGMARRLASALADRVALGADAVAAKAAVTPTALPTTLALKREQLGLGGAQALAQAISGDALVSLRLFKCGLTLAGLRHVADAVARSRTLKHLHICKDSTLDSVDGVGAALARCLRENGGSLQSLVCSEVRIVDLGALAQAVAQEGPTALTHLSIRGAGLPLRLPVVAPGRWKWLTALRGLTHLSLRKNVISEEHFEIFLLQLFGQGSERLLMEHLLSELSPRERPLLRAAYAAKERMRRRGRRAREGRGRRCRTCWRAAFWNSSDGTGWRALRERRSGPPPGAR